MQWFLDLMQRFSDPPTLPTYILTFGYYYVLLSLLLFELVDF